MLMDAEGRPLDAALWERLLGGVTREVYASVYGFSLSELQSFASLTSEGVRNALYGASFGMTGLRSPGAALKKLNGSMEELFRARGTTPRLSTALREWEDVRRDMRRAEEDAARYDGLAAELDKAREQLAALRAERSGSVLSVWSPCPPHFHKTVPHGSNGRWNADRMRRGRWNSPGNAWSGPGKCWAPVWRMRRCCAAANVCASWPG